MLFRGRVIDPCYGVPSTGTYLGHSTARDGAKFCTGAIRPRPDFGDTVFPFDVAAMSWARAPGRSFEYDSLAARITWSSIAFGSSSGASPALSWVSACRLSGLL